MRIEKTICAPATGTGGAIAIIRVSGSQSLNICDKIFFSLDNSIKLIDQKGFTIVFGDRRYLS